MPTRSRIPVIQKRAAELIDLINNEDPEVKNLVLDALAPLPDAGEASAQPEKPEKAATCKFVLPDGEMCGTLAGDVLHGTGPSQHKFQVRKSRTKKVLPESVKTKTAEDVRRAQEFEPSACVQCLNPPDANVHHLSGFPGYHEYKEAA